MTRFDLDMDGSMEPSEQGKWVRYEDTLRTWVGLTDEEKVQLWNHDTDAPLSYADAIESAIRSKNT